MRLPEFVCKYSYFYGKRAFWTVNKNAAMIREERGRLLLLHNPGINICYKCAHI